MAASGKRTRVADLKQQVDAGISRHIAMSRALPNWLDEYETKRTYLNGVISDTTICTRRTWIRGLITELEALNKTIKLAWDLKEEQLATLTEVLYHGNYSNTGLKDFSYNGTTGYNNYYNNTGLNNTNSETDETDSEDEDDKECEEVLKSLDHYIKLANETHVEEGNRTERYQKELADWLEWWRTQPCDCIWSDWGPWSPCTKTCGEGANAGTTQRTRTVSREALNNGEECSGSFVESKKCNVVCCPVDCTWKSWSEWTQCEEKCPVGGGEGNVTRHRSRANEHECNGDPCQGNTEESKGCNIINIMQVKIQGQQNKIGSQQNTIGSQQVDINTLKTKLCALLNCQNGGVCEEGVCKCKPRYQGTSCEEYYSTPAGYDYKGCFYDKSSNRMLREQYYVRNDLTPDTCKDLCSGYKYFGVEYAKECFCGDYLRHKEEKDELQCNYQCPGNSSIACGGKGRLNLYERKVQPVCPLGYELTPGDVPGRGDSIKSGGYDNINLIDDCKDLCNSNALCCSFEWSPTEKSCHLNKECLPTKGWYKDYLFCHKTINDLISHISLTTRDAYSANSEDNLRLEVCQGSSCCKTNKLPGQYLRGQTATWTESAVLNDCSGMRIDVNENVQVTIDASELTNDWKGQAISISTVDGQSTYCPINTNQFIWTGRLTSYQATCSPGISGVSVITRDIQWADSEDNLRLRICQGTSCCNTNKLPGKYPQGETATWTEFAVLNDCLGMTINVNENVEVTIDGSDLPDGWIGQAISISTMNGQSTYCPINTSEYFKNCENCSALRTLQVTCSAAA